MVLAALLVAAGLVHMVRTASVGRLGQGTVMRRNASFVGILVPLFLCAAFMVKPFEKGVTASAATCLNNARQMSTSLLLYTEEADGLLPPAEVWRTASTPYTQVANPNLEKCGEVDHAYAFNAALGGATLAEHVAQPLLFESSTHQPDNAGDVSILIAKPRHEAGATIATTDGAASVRSLSFARESLAPVAKAGP